MRVCIINEYFHPDNTGGTGTVLSELARTLTDRYRDVSIDVITSRNLYRGDDLLAPQENWDGIQITRLSCAKPNGVSIKARLIANLDFSRKALTTLFRKERYDVILIGTAPPTATLAAEWYKRLTGAPYVYIVYDLEPDRAVVTNLLSPLHPAVKILRKNQRRWLHNANSVVVLGRCMKDYIGFAYSLPADKLEVIPIGADPESIVPGSHDTEFRRRHGLDGFVVLYSGNFGRYHDFDTILDSAATLKNTDPSVTLVLVGDGVQRQHIQDRIKDDNLTNVRHFPFVPQSEYSDLLASADVSLVTLEPGMEGLCVPSKFYSILASGRPTLAMMAPSCEVARVLDEEHCGLHLPVGDADKFVQAIGELSRNPQLVSQMGSNARIALTRKYSKEAIADHYYRVLMQAMNKHASKPGEITSANVHFSQPAAPLVDRERDAVSPR